MKLFSLFAITIGHAAAVIGGIFAARISEAVLFLSGK
jgi:hypothetical protein